MFVYSCKAGTLKFFGVICLSLALLITLIAFVPTLSDGSVAVSAASQTDYNYDKVKTEADVVQFLSQFGWTVNGEVIEKQEVTLPEEFDKVFAGYNEIQKEQGLDLTKYRKKKVQRYTCEVTNYPEYQGKVLANVLVYRGKVIGGDICSADVTGFVHGFEKK